MIVFKRFKWINKDIKINNVNLNNDVFENLNI